MVRSVLVRNINDANPARTKCCYYIVISSQVSSSNDSIAVRQLYLIDENSVRNCNCMIHYYLIIITDARPYPAKHRVNGKAFTRHFPG